MAKITVTKEFNTRAELDEFVRTRIGTNTEANTGHTIEVSPEEATKLGLSESVNVYGVSIVATEEK